MTRRSRILTHRVDTYAVRVHDREISAGPLVRAACERHIRDRMAEAGKAGHARGFTFHAAAADHILQFFESVLLLPDTLGRDGAPSAFVLTPANAFIVGALFGWKAASGWRRFREAYIEMGKGNGKTPLAAGMGLYGLIMDGEQAAEIYSVATGIEQARICWRDADRMVEASPDLAARVNRSSDNLAYAETYSWFRPLSKEKRGKSGPRPHMAFFDELHEYADAVVVNKVRAGAKRRSQPLFVDITNSGFDRTSICWQHHEHARRVMEGLVEDEQLFAYVCALDTDEDPLTDSTCHVKANPNLGLIIHQPYLDRQVLNAGHVPSERNDVLRLNFCVWTKGRIGFFDMDAWRACGEDVAHEDLIGMPCYGGLDLGQSDDFSAWARVWLLPDGRKVVRVRFWIPAAALTTYPDRPYDQWRREGVLNVTEGDIVDYDLIEQQILEDARSDGVLEIAYDKRFAQQMALHLQGHDVVMVDTPQGWGLNEAVKTVHEWVTAGEVRHGRHPILEWMADNTVVRHGPHRTIRLDKEASREKIDGISALVMAASRVIANAQPVPQEDATLLIMGYPT